MIWKWFKLKLVKSEFSFCEPWLYIEEWLSKRLVKPKIRIENENTGHYYGNFIKSSIDSITTTISNYCCLLLSLNSVAAKLVENESQQQLIVFMFEIYLKFNRPD